MLIGDFVQKDTKIVERVIHHDAEYYENKNGQYEVKSEAWDETVTEEIPIMGMVYRRMTPEEESAYLAEQIEAETHRFDGMSYSDIVESLIRERYSVSDELAILRQRDIKADEFEAYNLFAEECKMRAKELI